MKEKRMKRLVCVLISLVVVLAPAAASATNGPPLPAVPEPSGALLFAAGVAVAAIAIRLIRRK